MVKFFHTVSFEAKILGIMMPSGLSTNWGYLDRHPKTSDTQQVVSVHNVRFRWNSATWMSLLVYVQVVTRRHAFVNSRSDSVSQLIFVRSFAISSFSWISVTTSFQQCCEHVETSSTLYFRRLHLDKRSHISESRQTSRWSAWRDQVKGILSTLRVISDRSWSTHQAHIEVEPIMLIF